MLEARPLSPKFFLGFQHTLVFCLLRRLAECSLSLSLRLTPPSAGGTTGRSRGSGPLNSIVSRVRVGAELPLGNPHGTDLPARAHEAPGATPLARAADLRAPPASASPSPKAGCSGHQTGQQPPRFLQSLPINWKLLLL